MATIPSKKLIRKMQKQTRKIERRKKITQLLKGKAFKNTGAGVVPEKIWRDLK